MHLTDISIVLPTYNGSAYLVESIESILRQSFSNWELIAVDDWNSLKYNGVIRKDEICSNAYQMCRTIRGEMHEIYD